MTLKIIPITKRLTVDRHIKKPISAKANEYTLTLPYVRLKNSSKNEHVAIIQNSRSKKNSVTAFCFFLNRVILNISYTAQRNTPIASDQITTKYELSLPLCT